jgi:YVTN family beta-propeller protein
MLVFTIAVFFTAAAAGCIDFRPEVKIVKYDVNATAGTITITYKLRDLDASKVNIYASWSIDGGATWENATSGGGSGISGLSPGESYQEYTYIWNYAADIGTGRLTNVFFKIAGNDGYTGKSARIGPLTLGNPLVFVANYETGKMHVINASTLAQLDNSDSGYHPVALAVSPDGAKVYVSNEGSQTISIYTVATGNFENTFQVGASPGALAISPDGGRLFALLENDDEIAVFDLENLSRIDTVPTGDNPVALAFSPDNSALYASSFGDNSICIYDPDNLAAPYGTITLAGPPADFCFSVLANGSIFCFVACQAGENQNGCLEVFDMDDAAGNHSFVSVGASPTAVEKDPSGYFVFVTNYDNDSVTVISSDTLSIIEANLEIPTARSSGAGPMDIALGNDGTTLYVACAKSGEVFTISATTFDVSMTAINLGGSPVAIGSSPIIKE